jgi:hypothetical protein
MFRSRRQVIGAVVVVVCIVGGVWAVRTVLAGRDPNTIHAPGSLPDHIVVCDRGWNRDELGRQVTYKQAQATKPSGDPSVVATGPFAPCPRPPCTETADGPCDTVVFVRVGLDAYIDYALAGGP